MNSESDIDLIFNRLYEHFDVKTKKELASKMDVEQLSLSKWYKHKMYEPIGQRCKELNIYDVIFTKRQKDAYPVSPCIVFNADYYIQKLMTHYHAKTSIVLAEKLQITSATISLWRKKNNIRRIEKKCLEMGVYEIIFDESQKKKAQQVSRDFFDKWIIAREISQTIDLMGLMIVKEQLAAAKKSGSIKAFLAHILAFKD